MLVQCCKLNICIHKMVFLKYRTLLSMQHIAEIVINAVHCRDGPSSNILIMKIPEKFKLHNTTLSSDCGHWYIYHYSLGIWKRRDKSVSTTEL